NGITQPGKLMRIAVMLRELQEEVRRASPDDAGRAMLRQLHERALQELCEVLSPDLQEELKELSLPFSDSTPTESEILIGQAQLVGWLEGLFQGIQVTLFNQQLQARAQFEQMRQRGLPQGGGVTGAPQVEPTHSTGQYL
ncbi:MAG: bacterial proteasome activator family protein, partial [Actinobacteria bacterium]|nr:bacterial proteasome activator family protein [Actinomycetota bacterium]